MGELGGSSSKAATDGVSLQLRPPPANTTSDPGVTPREREAIGRLGRHYKAFSKRHGVCITLFTAALLLLENDTLGYVNRPRCFVVCGSNFAGSVAPRQSALV